MPLPPCRDEAQQPNASGAVNASAARDWPPAAAMVVAAGAGGATFEGEKMVFLERRHEAV